MLIIRIKGGLGNQLFQYAGAKGLAASLGHRLKIDRQTGFPGYPRDPYNRSYRLDRFHIPQVLASKAEIWAARAISWRRWFRWREDESKAMHERREFFHPELARQAGARIVYLEAYLQSPRYFANVEENLRSELCPSVEPDLTMNQYLRLIQGVHAVSLHLRRKEHGSERPVPMNYYRQAVSTINAQVTQPHFFIFADDLELGERELEWLRPKTIVRNASPDDDVKDLALMAACQHHIIANSTFSWWGAWLGTDRVGLTIAPQWGWTQSGDLPQNLFPHGWILI